MGASALVILKTDGVLLAQSFNNQIGFIAPMNELKNRRIVRVKNLCRAVFFRGRGLRAIFFLRLDLCNFPHKNKEQEFLPAPPIIADGESAPRSVYPL